MLLGTMKPPPVRTEQAAVSELTSEPLSSCMPVGLPACLTDCLFVSRPVSLFKAALFARRSVFNIVRERAKKRGRGGGVGWWGRSGRPRETIPSYAFPHTQECGVARTAHTVNARAANKRADLCSIPAEKE